MNKPTLYLETTILSYLLARLSRDILTLARQQLTRDWWEYEHNKYEIVISTLVQTTLEESPSDLRDAPAEYLRSCKILPASSKIDQRAVEILQELPTPSISEADAHHLACAMIHEIEYFLTWQFKTLANAFVRRRLDGICRQHGWFMPTIGTPEHMMSDDVGWKDPIVEEVRAARAELMREAGGTMEGLFKMLMESQKKRGRKLVQPPRTRKAKTQ
jgi:predicted nucleic acid-binding protein